MTKDHQCNPNIYPDCCYPEPERILAWVKLEGDKSGLYAKAQTDEGFFEARIWGETPTRWVTTLRIDRSSPRQGYIPLNGDTLENAVSAVEDAVRRYVEEVRRERAEAQTAKEKMAEAVDRFLSDPSH